MPAESNSFIQLLVSLTGTGTLRKQAATGCLGGQDNFPRELRDLQIQFGDLTVVKSKGGAAGKDIVRCAGFGVPREVGPLAKRAKYGLPEY